MHRTSSQSPLSHRPTVKEMSTVGFSVCFLVKTRSGRTETNPQANLRNEVEAETSSGPTMHSLLPARVWEPRSPPPYQCRLWEDSLWNIHTQGLSHLEVPLGIRDETGQKKLWRSCLSPSGRAIWSHWTANPGPTATGAVVILHSQGTP